MMSSPAPPNSAVPLLDIPDGISIWDADALEAERRRNSSDDRVGRLMQTINSLGLRSQMAQGINAVLTSVARLRENRQARLYLLCKDGYGLGILKVGVKKLFVTHPVQHCLVEIDPLCVLDFFVDEKCQRCGYGRQLFEHMLTHERLRPEQVAIDRPSTQFLAFLHRHYGLVEYTPQSNKFVVFHRYFSRWQPPRGRGRDISGGPVAPLPAVRPLGRGPPRDQTLEQRPPGPARQTPPPPVEGTNPPGPSAQQAPDPSPEKPKSPYELQYEAYMRQEAEREQRHKEWQLYMQQHQQRCRRGPPQKPLAQADFCAANRGTEPCGMNSGARGR